MLEPRIQQNAGWGCIREIFDHFLRARTSLPRCPSFVLIKDTHIRDTPRVPVLFPPVGVLSVMCLALASMFASRCRFVGEIAPSCAD